MFSAHEKRKQLDHRRFEAAHLKYTSLKMVSWYPETTSYSNVKFESDVKTRLHLHCFLALRQDMQVSRFYLTSN